MWDPYLFFYLCVVSLLFVWNWSIKTAETHLVDVKLLLFYVEANHNDLNFSRTFRTKCNLFSSLQMWVVWFLLIQNKYRKMLHLLEPCYGIFFRVWDREYVFDHLLLYYNFSWCLFMTKHHMLCLAIFLVIFFVYEDK